MLVNKNSDKYNVERKSKKLKPLSSEPNLSVWLYLDNTVREKKTKKFISNVLMEVQRSMKDHHNN